MLSVRAVYILSSLQLQLGTQTLKEAGVPKAERDDLEQIMDDLKTASPKEKPRLIEKAKILGGKKSRVPWRCRFYRDEGTP